MLKWVNALFEKVITSSTTGNLSTKRLIMLLSAVALILGFLVLIVAGARWTWRTGDIGSGAVTAILGVAATVGGLAGLAYRKPENKPE